MRKEHQEVFWNNIEKEFKKSGLSQKEFAKILNITPAYLNGLLKQNRSGERKFIQICDSLNKDYKEMLGIIDHDTKQKNRDIKKKYKLQPENKTLNYGNNKGGDRSLMSSEEAKEILSEIRELNKKMEKTNDRLWGLNDKIDSLDKRTTELERALKEPDLSEEERENEIDTKKSTAY